MGPSASTGQLGWISLGRAANGDRGRRRPRLGVYRHDVGRTLEAPCPIADGTRGDPRFAGSGTAQNRRSSSRAARYGTNSTCAGLGWTPMADGDANTPYSRPHEQAVLNALVALVRERGGPVWALEVSRRLAPGRTTSAIDGRWVATVLARLAAQGKVIQVRRWRTGTSRWTLPDERNTEESRPPRTPARPIGPRTIS